MDAKYWDEAVIRWRREREYGPSSKQDELRIEALAKHLSGVRLDKINANVIASIIDSFQKAGKKNSTINRDLVPLKVILRKACDEWDWIVKIPKIRTLREPEGRTRWLTAQEARDLLKALPPHLRAMAHFSLSTGLRASNVSNLMWSQVDLERRVCWIHADQSKNRRAFPVPLNDTAIEILKGQLGIHAAHVFTFNGRRIRQVTNKTWRRAAASVGLSGVTFHTMRHTFASWHIQSGTSEYELMQLGGWKSDAMVRRYAHFSADHLQKAARKCSSFLSEISAQVVVPEGEISGAGNEARTRDLNLGNPTESSLQNNELGCILDPVKTDGDGHGD